MHSALIVVHLIITLFLVAVILLQNTASGALGSMGGGSGVFSPRGGKTFLTRLTGILATLFICNSLLLAFVAKNAVQSPSPVDSLLEAMPQGSEQSLPASNDPSNDLLPPAALPETPQPSTVPETSKELEQPEVNKSLSKEENVKGEDSQPKNSQPKLEQEATE